MKILVLSGVVALLALPVLMWAGGEFRELRLILLLVLQGVFLVVLGFWFGVSCGVSALLGSMETAEIHEIRDGQEHVYVTLALGPFQYRKQVRKGQ